MLRTRYEFSGSGMPVSTNCKCSVAKNYKTQNCSYVPICICTLYINIASSTSTYFAIYKPNQARLFLGYVMLNWLTWFFKTHKIRHYEICFLLGSGAIQTSRRCLLWFIFRRYFVEKENRTYYLGLPECGIV